MDKKELKRKFKENELAVFRELLPMKEADFLPLFDFLDNGLSENGCKNDFSLLEKYCEKEKLDFTKLKEWFKKHGGYCDCEISSNVEEQFEYLKNPIIVKPKQVKVVQKQKLETLTTDFGFSIEKIPDPWVLNAVYQDNSIIYQFKIGKKSDFPMILEGDFPVGMLSNDQFLHEYWIEKTELDRALNFVVERQSTYGFETIQVRENNFLPVFIFIYRQRLEWCLVMKTESHRVKNDMKEIEKLLKEIQGA